MNVVELLLKETEFGADIQNVDSIIPEDKIEIYCNGHYLDSTLQLKDVKQMLWRDDQLLP